MSTKPSFWNRKRISILMLAPIFSLLAYIAADFGVSQWLKTHFIGVDLQEIKCLPWTAFLYSKKPFRDDLHYGDLVVFRSQGLEPIFKDGSLLTKFAAGLPGDKVEIRNDRAYVNGVYWDRLWGLTYLHEPPGSYDRSFVIKDDEILTLSVNAGSYDGRYWGPLKKDRIVGYAKAIF